MKSKKQIGIIGLAMRSPDMVGGNLGCYALGYSFFEILDEIAKKDDSLIRIVQIKSIGIKGLLKLILKYILFRRDKTSYYYTGLYDHLEFSSGYALFLRGGIKLQPMIKQCDCIFDFTAGDSFTDLYGKGRFYKRTRLKRKVIESHLPLILGSQTIGPFKDDEVRQYAIDVINRCKAVFVRDVQSKHYVEDISKAKPIQTTDVAFFLPYKKEDKLNGKKWAGFNPSGLLWNGGYTGKNQFGLTVDYQEYCKKIIRYLLGKGYEVHLIMHAFSVKEQEGSYYTDNDKLAVDALHEIFPSTIVSPEFTTPMEAKSYISKMKLFIGARMHATIAALSSGTPVIPFSYSRKFEGLYESIDYSYVVEGTKWNTDEAVETTKRWIDDIDKIYRGLNRIQDRINKEKTSLLHIYRDTLA